MTIQEEIQTGESRTLEYKASLPHDSQKWIKTIVAFANGAGGKLNVIEGWGTVLKRIIDFCKEKNVEPLVFEEIAGNKNRTYVFKMAIDS